jgi:hypothetical protein
MPEAEDGNSMAIMNRIVLGRRMLRFQEALLNS